jgi:thiamine biosynthesis lipoprotein
MKSPCAELKRARPLLGTIVEITVRSDGMQGKLEAIDRAFGAISAVQQRMSFHDPKSMLSQVNTHAFARSVPVDEKTFQVLEMARDLYLLSDGLFDPTIAPELERAGFLPRAGGTSVEKATSFADVELLSRYRVRFRRMGIRVDLGGVAKGFAVDEAIAALRAAGVESGLVNAGGDLRVFGGQSFAVEIRDPSHPGRTLAPFPVRNLALATSAHYFAHRLNPGARIGPFVHPRLRQLQGDLLSVTVTASSAMLADALTKIVMLDPAKSLALLARFDAAALVFDPNGSIQCTPSWYETIQAAA